MSYDIHPILAEIDPGNPCGKDIAYDASFMELEKLLQPPSDGPVGPAAETSINWKEIASKSYELLKISKNLRVAVCFAFSMFREEGFEGLQKGLELLKVLLERYWENLYPRLDPDDNFDPIERINILRSLSPEPSLIQPTLDFTKAVIETPFCRSGQMGAFSYQDYQVASGEIKLPEGSTEAIPTVAQIQAAIKDTSSDELSKVISALAGSEQALSEINDVFSQHANGQSPNFENLQSGIAKLSRLLKGSVDNQQTNQPQTAEEKAVQGAVTAAVPAGNIRSKADVVRMLDMICQYFENNEPSSPVPLLLRRAQKLTSKNFMELIEDICPDAINQVRVISGNTEENK